MTRPWCPALSADLETTFDREHLHNPKSPTQRNVAAKVIGAQAANSSATSVARVDMAADRIASSPPSKFSSRVAASAEVANEETIAHVHRVHIAQPVVPLVPTVPDEHNSIVNCAAPVVLRSLSHLSLLPDGEKIRSVDLSRVDGTSDEVAAALAHAKISHVDSIAIRHTLRGTLGVATVLKQLHTDKRPVVSLDLGLNPAAFAVGEEPNAPAVEEGIKFLNSTPSLHVLSFRGTGLGAASATLLPALRAHSGIVSLDISKNNLGLQQDEAAIAALTQLIQDNKFILKLDLSDNEIGAPLAKQLLEGLQNSDTRVKTPEAEPEPEVEEYTDEVPPEEEAPQVTVGFPPEEPSAAAVPEGEVDPNQAASPAPPPDADTTAEPVDEENATPEATPEPAGEAAEPTEEELEAMEAKKKEEEEQAAAALRQKEDEWKAKMKQYIWDPEQTLFQYKESVARRAIIAAYVSETIAEKKVEKQQKKASKHNQLDRERRERERRSGWSHLQQLDLSGNAIGNVGAKSLALAIRHEIPLSADEKQTKEEESQKQLADLQAAARETRRKELAAQRKKEREEALKAQVAAGAPEAAPPTEAPEATTDEAEINPETAVVEDAEIIPADGDAVKESEEKEEGDAVNDDEIDVSDITVPPVLGTKPGLRTVRVLQLNQCSIGTSGLKQLAKAVAKECPTLQVLSLRKNKFGTKKQVVAVAKDDAAEEKEDAEGDEGEQATAKVEMPGWVSPGLMALSDALKTAAQLSVLDLSWNRLYPNSIRELAAGLSSNSSIVWLGLDGNRIGVADEADSSALATLLGAVKSQGKIRTLLVGNCELEVTFGSTEANLLASLDLREVNLSGNQFSNDQIATLASCFESAAHPSPITTLMLENNTTLTAEVGLSIGKLIAKLPSLENISFRNCVHLGDEGVLKSLTQLVHGKNLKRISFHRCGLVKVFEVLQSSLGHLKSLVSCDVGDNECPVELMKGFTEGLCDGIPLLQALTLWSRSGDSESLLPCITAQAAKFKKLVYCDVGIPLMFKRNDPAEDGSVFEDDLEELEKQCLANRLAAL